MLLNKQLMWMAGQVENMWLFFGRGAYKYGSLLLQKGHVKLMYLFKFMSKES